MGASLLIPLLLGGLAGAAAGGAFSGNKSSPAENLSKPAENVKKTAEPVEQLTEQAKKNRRLAASSLTQGLSKPTLGTPGLLGTGQGII